MALLVDREVCVAVVGWPRHSPEFTGVPVDGPVLAVAAKGQGAAIVDLNGNFYPVQHTTPRSRALSSASKAPKDLKLREWLCKRLGIEEQTEMVSMTKAFAVGCCQAVLYVRALGLISGHHEWVWDIAPLDLFVREAGGFVTTETGAQLVYADNAKVGEVAETIIITNNGEEFHKKVLAAYREYLETQI
jgi:3'(2'), 5'-bisphosphate nucleotidase